MRGLINDGENFAKYDEWRHVRVLFVWLEKAIKVERKKGITGIAGFLILPAYNLSV